MTALFDACPGDNERIQLLQSVQGQIKGEGRTLTDAEICLLFRNCGHENAQIREECLRTLECWSGALARVAALALLLDASVLVRTTAVEVLEFSGEIQDRYALERVLAFDEEWIMRASAVSSLAGIPGAAGKAAILRALGDENAHVRRYAAVALARVGNAADVGVLRKAEATERDEAAKVGIYLALYQLGDASCLPKMLGLIETDFPDVDLQIVILGALNEYLFPADFARVAAYVRTLNPSVLHPEVRALAKRLSAKIEKS